jgi:hypothetical protein
MITAMATGCNGPSTAFHLATTNPRPGSALSGPVAVCVGTTGNVYTTDAGMSGYTWTISAGGTIVGSTNTNSINVYPVPNNGRFTIPITTASDESFSIRVYNNLGVKIYEDTKVDLNGSLQKVIDLRPVFDGVYTVVILNSNCHVVKKVVITK